MTASSVRKTPPNALFSDSSSNSNSPSQNDSPITAFFYGTLMVPEIFFRVTHSTESPDATLRAKYSFVPALLRHYSRRRVLYCDFPAIIPQQGHTVLGAYVTGLTREDIGALNRFEGSMYTLEECVVQLLPEDAVKEDGSTNQEVLDLATNQHENGNKEEVKARTYVWCNPVEDLEAEDWSYADFRRKKLMLWVYEKDEEYVDAWNVQKRVNIRDLNENVEAIFENNDEVEDCEWSGRKKATSDEKVEDVEEEEESDELRTKRIVSVIAGIATEEEAAELEDAKKEVLASAV